MHLSITQISGLIFLLCIGGFLLQSGGDFTEKKKEIVPISLACKQHDQMYARVTCLLPYFNALTHEQSAGVAIAEAMKLQKDGFIDDCHLIAHEVGQAAFQRYASSVEDAFASCTLGCIEGCFHGVMQEYVEVTGSLREVALQTPVLCKDVGTDMLLHRQCVHGIGHGLLSHDLEKFMDVIGLCKSLPSAFYQDTCIGGVLMENVNAYLALPEARLRDELQLICAATEEDSALLSRCLQSVGEGLMFYTGHNLERSKDVCSGLPPQQQADCVAGAEHESKTNKAQSLNSMQLYFTAL